MGRIGFVASFLPTLLLLGVTQCSDISGRSSSNAGAGASSGPSVAGAGGSGNAGAGSHAGLGGASAAGGVAGSLSGGAGAAGSPDLGPTPAMPGVNFPFPQNRLSSNCRYPAFRNSDVRAAYEWWKKDTVTADGAGGHLRVKRTPTDGGTPPAASTVSEGIGYGMLIAVYMNDQPLFDELWKYEQLWLNKNGLMDWNIDAAE
jgi:hypothetical protein